MELLYFNDYENEIRRQLDDRVFYEFLSADPTNKLKTCIHSKLLSHFENGEFSKNEYEFLKVDFPITPIIYTLPKVHKGLDTPLKGRPIVSGIGSLTENISSYVDFYIKSFVPMLSSYVRNSMDFIESLYGVDFAVDDVLLATFDVQSLYTNIPHTDGLLALEFFLTQRSVDVKPSTACLLDLASIVLTNNFFRFQDDFYLQVKGTAMGSKMAPNYACLYMGVFENDYFK